METIFKEITNLIRTTGPWLSKRWLVALPVIGLLAALLLTYLGLIPTIPEKEDHITIQFYKWITIILLPIFLVLLWLVWTQVYLRSGKGVKIGLVYEGYKVDVSDWKQTRTILKDLFKDDKLKNCVSLRFVPLRATEAEKIGQKFSERYGFTILLTLQHSKTDEGKVSDNIGLSVNTHQHALPYMKTTIEQSLSILHLRSNRQNQTALDMLKNKALSLHDMLLLFVATHDYVTRNFEDASIILGHIDQELGKLNLHPMEPPRLQIRDFFVRSCVSKLDFPLTQIPMPDKLEKRIQFAERAMPLFDDFAAVYTWISRAKFLLGDVESAVQLTERFNRQIEEMQKDNQSINPEVLFTRHLNSGFLSFVQGLWQNAFMSYNQMFTVQEYKQDWDKLVEFIDYVHSLERFDGIPYLQVLYRKLAGQSIPKTLNDAANKWIQADGSRKIFRSLLGSAHCINSNMPNTKRRKKNKKKRRPERRKAPT